MVPLIDTTSLLRIADRAAYQYSQIDAVCTAIQATGVEKYFTTVSNTGDPDVEIPCGGPFYEVDSDFSTVRAATFGTLLPSIVYGMEGHFDRVFQVGGWDGYLNDNNKRVSYYFARLYYDCKKTYMLANNVFSESSDQFARIQVAAGPTMVFTDGVNYGTGADSNPANGTFYAATQLKIVVTTMGVINVDIRLSVKDVNNNPTTIDVTVPGGSASGAVINVGSSANRYLDVIGASFVPSGTTGTVGDDLKVMNLKERQIAL